MSLLSKSFHPLGHYITKIGPLGSLGSLARPVGSKGVAASSKLMMFSTFTNSKNSIFIQHRNHFLSFERRRSFSTKCQENSKISAPFSSWSSSSSSSSSSKSPVDNDESETSPKKIVAFRIIPKRIQVRGPPSFEKTGSYVPTGSPEQSKTYENYTSQKLQSEREREREREQEQEQEQESDWENYQDTSHKGRFLRPFLFTVGVSISAFCTAVILTYEESWRMARSFFATDFSLFKVKLTKSGSNSNPSFREVLENEWRTMSESTKTIGTIIALNCAVFLAWKIKPLKNFMQTHFTSSPVTGRAWPMLLSAFSHFSALHLGSNMIALASFGAAAHDMLGRNQFLALYFSSAVISSFAGLVAKNALGRTIPSLGASGAIMSIAFYICTMLPHTHISIIFFPFHPIEAWKGAAGMVALDFLGLVFRWRIFDHAAHLGGAAVGIFYAYKGQELIWGDFYRFLIPHYLETKQAFLKWWKRISGKSF